jgi:hypothetical protein
MDREMTWDGMPTDCRVVPAPVRSVGASVAAVIVCPDDARIDAESQARLIVAAMVCPLS